MELWDLLDENRNKIGKTHIRGEKLPEGTFHLVVDIWIVNANKEILIQKRSMQKESNPGIWAMTSGSVSTGETSIQGAQREVSEELGIILSEEELKLIDTRKGKEAFLDTYIVKKDIPINKMVLQKEEVSEAKWVTFDEIEKMIDNGEFIKNRWNNINKYLFL